MFWKTKTLKMNYLINSLKKMRIRKKDGKEDKTNC